MDIFTIIWSNNMNLFLCLLHLVLNTQVVQLGILTIGVRVSTGERAHFLGETCIIKAVGDGGDLHLSTD